MKQRGPDGDRARQCAVEAAKEAGDILLTFFGGPLTKKIKTGPDDYATEADEAAEQAILDRLTKAFPEDAIVTEETGLHGNRDAAYAWIVDPLDGTHNFASGRQDFGVMIARACGEQIELAVVTNPASGMIAIAERGKGTTLNGRPGRLKRREPRGYIGAGRHKHQPLEAVGNTASKHSAAANALAALAGEYRAFVGSGGFIWDFAPPALLLAEAGWTVTDISGRPFRWQGRIIKRGRPGIIAAPSDLHGQLVQIIVKR